MGRKQKLVEDLRNFLDLHFSAFIQAIQHYKVLAIIAQHSFKSADNACSVDIFLAEYASDAKHYCRQMVHQLPYNASDDYLYFQ